MFRILLIVALLAVTYDAYRHQGLYTRTVIDGTIEGVSRISQSINTTQGTTAKQPS